MKYYKDSFHLNKMPPSNPLPPKENALFKRILVSSPVNIVFRVVYLVSSMRLSRILVHFIAEVVINYFYNKPFIVIDCSVLLREKCIDKFCGYLSVYISISFRPLS